jgi:methylated-DNA-protein-cysteine methyltransferase related protein
VTPFQSAVAAVIAALEPGQVVTYGEVAAEAGYPGAARAVGTFLRDFDGWLGVGGRELPWWRVVRADGRLLACHEAEQTGRLTAEGVLVRDGRINPGAGGRRPGRGPRVPRSRAR